MDNNEQFDHKAIESKWKQHWSSSNVYSPSITELQNADNKYYNLMMFPYPSAEGLHVGNMYAFSGADIFGRFQRMQGKTVLEPIGLDGFGIHSENYAIKVGRHPKEHAKVSQENFYNQLSSIGNGFAWDYRLETYDPAYYKWTQWLFTQMFKKGLAYRSAATVNWCPSDKTVLADEQVVDDCCERCGTKVERREMTSWYFKITDYAQRLLENIDSIEWPEKIKIAQKHWIGRKEGINISYPIKDSDTSITCFTTRPDTNFGASFIVVAPEYAKEHLLDLVSEEHKRTVEDYINKSLAKSEQQRKAEGNNKTGEFTGLYVINKLNEKDLPIWVSDFVLMDVGTGAVVGVPAHDSRDFDFAKKFDLPITKVIEHEGEDVFEGEGKVINSGFLDGMNSSEAKQKVMDHLEEKGWGERSVNYHLRDWIISRQRYWGPPIPMVNCDKCGWQPVADKELPVELPDIDDFKPKGDGTSPLANAPEEWKNTKCPNCGGEAKRELDVSDTFLDSSWYFLAYPNLNSDEWKGNQNPFNKELTSKWLPVDSYIGGAEHAVLHLLYARFVTMVLKDLGYLSFDEPFPFLFGHGLIIKDGAKMSKSKGNVIVPDEYIEKYGADTLRTYLMFLGPFENGGDFRDTGIEGMRRFVERVWDLLVNNKGVSIEDPQKAKELLVKYNKTVKKVTEDIAKFRYNTAISSIMELVNEMRTIANVSKKHEGVECAEWNEASEGLTLMLAPFMPFLAEEVWHETLGKDDTVHKHDWPTFNAELIVEETFEMPVQVNGRFRTTITIRGDDSEEEMVLNIAKGNEVVQKWIENRQIKKVIYVKGKMLNLIVS